MYRKIVHMRVLHLADLHVRCSPTNNDRYAEYKSVFDRIVRAIPEVYPDICLIAGDVFHSKYKCSARGADLFRSFVRCVSRTCPVYILAGNHDFQQSQTDSPDLVTAVLGNCDIPGVTLMNETGVYRFEDLSISVVTVQDAMEVGATCGHRDVLPEFPKDVSETTKYRVAAFHGPVAYSRLSNGSDLQGGVPVSWFDGFDAVMLGDIHVPQVHRAKVIHTDERTKTWSWDAGANPWGYCGSTIQQNFGEGILRHGFMVWDLRTRTVTHHHVPNDYGFADAYYVDGAWKVKIGETYVDKESPLVPRHTEFRVRSDVGSLERTELCDESRIKKIRRPIPDIDVSEYLTESEHYTDDWKVVADLSKLEFHDDVSDKIRNRVSSLMNQIDRFQEGHSSNSFEPFSISKLEIHNILCYRGLLEVDFRDMKGRIVGLVGPNSSGKTSFLESICMAVFGSGYRTSEDIITRDETFASTEVTLNNNVVIRREFSTRSGRFTTKLATVSRDGAVIHKGKVAVDNYVKATFGTLDMFLTSSCITQGNDCDFLDMTPDKRTEYLDRILGLSHIDSTKTYLKEACLIQRNIVEYLETKMESLRYEDPEPIIQKISEERTGRDLRTAEEKTESARCASLQCEPASIVDISKSRSELETIHVSDFDIFDIQGRRVECPRPYDAVYAEYQAHKTNQPPEPQRPVSTKTYDMECDMDTLASAKRQLETRLDETEERLAVLRETLDDICSRQPSRPSLTQQERDRLDVETPPKIITNPKSEHTGPHNPECWACNERIGVNHATRFAAWFHAHIQKKDEYDAYQQWTKHREETVKQLERCRAHQQRLETELDEVSEKIRFCGHAEYSRWEKRHIELCNELFTVFFIERQKRDRVTKLRKCIRHTEYCQALEKVSLIRNAISESNNRIRDLENRLESVMTTNQRYRTMSETLRVQTTKMVNLKHLLDHYTGYKDYLYRTTIGPHICDTATSILANIADMTISETGMRFRINGLHVNRAGGFQRSVASVAIRIAISKICTQMFVDEGFVACDRTNVHRVIPFLRKLLTVYDGILLCSHIEDIIEETDTKWTFLLDRQKSEFDTHF